MAVTPLKVLLFLAGASGAAGGTAYFAGALDPYIQPVAACDCPRWRGHGTGCEVMRQPCRQARCCPTGEAAPRRNG